MKNPITQTIEPESPMVNQSLILLRARPFRRLTETACPALLTAIFLVALSGCNIVAPIVYIASGPQKTDARYELDASRTTVIFIDDRFNRAPRRSLRMVAAETAEQRLLGEKALEADKLITTRAVMRVASQEQFSSPKSIAQLGQAVGAEVVVYAVIDSWSLSSDNVTFTPGVAVRVKVIDAAADKRLWPPEGAGYPVTAAMPTQTIPLPTSADRDNANLELARLLGEQIAKVFFKHEKDTLSGRLDD